MFLVRVQQISGISIVLLMLLDVLLTYVSADETNVIDTAPAF